MKPGIKTTDVLGVLLLLLVLSVVLLGIDRRNQRTADLRRACVEAGHDPLACLEMTRDP